MDSTNGDPEARAHYASLLQPDEVITVKMDYPSEASDWAAARCFARHYQGHDRKQNRHVASPGLVKWPTTCGLTSDQSRGSLCLIA